MEGVSPADSGLPQPPAGESFRGRRDRQPPVTHSDFERAGIIMPLMVDLIDLARGVIGGIDGAQCP